MKLKKVACNKCGKLCDPRGLPHHMRSHPVRFPRTSAEDRAIEALKNSDMTKVWQEMPLYEKYKFLKALYEG